MPGTSNVAASPIGSGNSVVPSAATPCSASLHQSYAGTLRRGIARAWFTSCDAFSSSVIRCTKSVARCSGDRLGFMYGNFSASCALAAETMRATQRTKPIEKRLVARLIFSPREDEDIEAVMKSQKKKTAPWNRGPRIMALFQAVNLKPHGRSGMRGCADPTLTRDSERKPSCLSAPLVHHPHAQAVGQSDRRTARAFGCGQRGRTTCAATTL